MIIFLYGEDSFRSRQKLQEIIDKYQTAHQSGLNLQRLKNNQLDFEELKNRIESAPMFQEKKLIILEDFLDYPFKDALLNYLKQSNLKNDQDAVVVFFETNRPDARGALFKELIKKPVMSQEFKFLSDSQLLAWVGAEVKKRSGQIEPGALRQLVFSIGPNLWQMNNELDKLLTYRSGRLITQNDIVLMVKSPAQISIFKTIDALAENNKRLALRLLNEHLEQGDNEIYLLSMITYQFRNLIQIKDALDRRLIYAQLIKKIGLHPFVLRKSINQVRNFSLTQLKNIYQKLLETEIAIKVGRLDHRTALEILVMEV